MVQIEQRKKAEHFRVLSNYVPMTTDLNVKQYNAGLKSDSIHVPREPAGPEIFVDPFAPLALTSLLSLGQKHSKKKERITMSQTR